MVVGNYRSVMLDYEMVFLYEYAGRTDLTEEQEREVDRILDKWHDDQEALYQQNMIRNAM